MEIRQEQLNRFGLLIERKRKQKGWSMSRLSKETGGVLSSSYICRIERSERESKNIAIHKVIKLAEALDIAIQDLVDSI
ncbi:MAG: helix-turn-helix domain-containing protein [Anaerobacillus sp.]|uniref:helix-turn-helix domain-containing protein n=1 Tax=Anaerobacillus sp. TaxID=1872506 RepID=UPI00391D57BD